MLLSRPLRFEGKANVLRLGVWGAFKLPQRGTPTILEHMQLNVSLKMNAFILSSTHSNCLMYQIVIIHHSPDWLYMVRHQLWYNNYDSFSRRNPSPDTTFLAPKKYAKTHLQQSRILKIFRGWTPGPPLKEEGKEGEGRKIEGGGWTPIKIPGSASVQTWQMCSIDRV